MDVQHSPPWTLEHAAVTERVVKVDTGCAVSIVTPQCVLDAHHRLSWQLSPLYERPTPAAGGLASMDFAVDDAGEWTREQVPRFPRRRPSPVPQNIEKATNDLDFLCKDVYPVLWASGHTPPHEAQFCSLYFLVLALTKSASSAAQFLYMVPNRITSSAPMKLAILLSKSKVEGNYARFFKTVRRAPYLMGCACHHVYTAVLRTQGPSSHSRTVDTPGGADLHGEGVPS